MLKETAADWNTRGGLDLHDDTVITEDDGKTYFYQKW